MFDMSYINKMRYGHHNSAAAGYDSPLMSGVSGDLVMGKHNCFLSIAHQDHTRQQSSLPPHYEPWVGAGHCQCEETNMLRSNIQESMFQSH